MSMAKTGEVREALLRQVANCGRMDPDNCPECAQVRAAAAELATLSAEVERLQARLGEARADARRYRWLRDSEDDDAVSSLIQICNYGQEAYLLDGPELDAAIDAITGRKE